MKFQFWITVRAQLRSEVQSGVRRRTPETLLPTLPQFKGSPSSGVDRRIGAAATRYQCSRKLRGLKGKRPRDSMASEASSRRVCAPAHMRRGACVCTSTGSRCMPAGVIDISKYAMADRSQRAGTNDCSTAHTTYEHIGSVRTPSV